MRPAGRGAWRWENASSAGKSNLPFVWHAQRRQSSTSFGPHCPWSPDFSQELRSAAAALSTCMHQMRQPKRPRDDDGALEVRPEGATAGEASPALPLAALQPRCDAGHGWPRTAHAGGPWLPGAAEAQPPARQSTGQGARAEAEPRSSGEGLDRLAAAAATGALRERASPPSSGGQRSPPGAAASTALETLAHLPSYTGPKHPAYASRASVARNQRAHSESTGSAGSRAPSPKRRAPAMPEGPQSRGYRQAAGAGDGFNPASLAMFVPPPGADPRAMLAASYGPAAGWPSGWPSNTSSPQYGQQSCHPALHLQHFASPASAMMPVGGQPAMQPQQPPSAQARMSYRPPTSHWPDSPAGPPSHPPHSVPMGWSPAGHPGMVPGYFDGADAHAAAAHHHYAMPPPHRLGPGQPMPGQGPFMYFMPAPSAPSHGWAHPGGAFPRSTSPPVGAMPGQHGWPSPMGAPQLQHQLQPSEAMASSAPPAVDGRRSLHAALEAERLMRLEMASRSKSRTLGPGGKPWVKGRMSPAERARVTEFVASVLDGRLRVRKGDLARELREFINPMRPPEFFEKLVSRRRLNDVLAAVLGPKVSRRARRQTDQVTIAPPDLDRLQRHDGTLPMA